MRRAETQVALLTRDRRAHTWVRVAVRTLTVPFRTSPSVIAGGGGRTQSSSAHKPGETKTITRRAARVTLGFLPPHFPSFSCTLLPQLDQLLRPHGPSPTDLCRSPRALRRGGLLQETQPPMSNRKAPSPEAPGIAGQSPRRALFLPAPSSPLTAPLLIPLLFRF